MSHHCWHGGLRPACGTVVKFLQPAQLAAVCRDGGTTGATLLEAEDMFAQRRRGRHSKRVIQPSGATEA